MNTYFYNELRRCCNEMNTDGENPEKISMVIDACKRVIDFANIARKEGLLALEEEYGKLDLNDPTQEFLSQEIMLVVDGEDPQLVTELGINRIVANTFASYDCLIVLLYYKAVLMIQIGENPRVVEKCMKSLMPDFVKNAYEEALSKEQKETKEAEDDKELIRSLCEDDKELIRSLCEDNKEINEKNHSIINQTALTLIELPDRDIQRLLRDIHNYDLKIAMKGLPGKARARIFDNVSTNHGLLIAKSIEYMGSVRAEYVEAVCVTILKTVIKLEDQAEIAGIEPQDLAILQAVLDMYKTEQKKNDELWELRKKYCDIIDQIYNDRRIDKYRTID